MGEDQLESHTEFDLSVVHHLAAISLSSATGELVKDPQLSHTRGSKKALISAFNPVLYVSIQHLWL